MRDCACAPALASEESRYIRFTLTCSRQARAGAVERRHAGRHMPRPTRLLEGVGEAQQGGLAPGAAGKGGTERVVGRLLVVEAGNEPGRHLDARIAGL